MNPMTDLGLRFVRRPGLGGWAANLAALGATAVVALLVTFLLAGSLGLAHRSDRIGWRSADGADPATARSSSTTRVRRPASSACAAVSPALATSGEVKTTWGTARSCAVSVRSSTMPWPLRARAPTQFSGLRWRWVAAPQRRPCAPGPTPA